MAVFDGMRVLVMEDNALLGMELSLALEDEGAEVIGPLAHLRSGLDEVSRAMPDAAVLDVELVDGQVFPLARVMAAAGVPFVFYTGSLNVGWTREQCMAHPVFAKTMGCGNVVTALGAEVRRSDPGGGRRA